LGASLAFIAAALGLTVTGALRSAQGRLLAGGAMIFAGCLSWRASPWLTIPDLAATAGLLAMAASMSSRGSILYLGFVEAGARVVHGFIHLILGLPFAVTPLRTRGTRVTQLAPIGRGILIAMPIAVVMIGLLASADPIFASFFNINLDIGQVVFDVSCVVLGALLVAGLLRLASARGIDPIQGPRRWLGFVETLVVVATLDVVFMAFAFAQAIAVGGNGADVLRRAGVTYSDYARSGFFQLLWVAGITLVILILVSRITVPNKTRANLAIRAGLGVAILLTLLIVYVSFQRLNLYEVAYGFTMLRLYSQIFAVWIGVVFAALSIDILVPAERQRWLLGAAGISGLLILLALNALNPEALVVQLNTDRAVSTNKLDVSYLQTLSADAIPAITASRTALPTQLRPALEQAVCSGPRTYRPAWAAINLGDKAAIDARRSIC
jgi:hypothetical protein